MESSWNQGTLATDRLAGNGRSAVTVLRVQGEHDLATAPSVRAALAEAGDGEALIVDLRDCTFVDSSIIAALLHARQERTAFAVVLPADPASAVRPGVHHRRPERAPAVQRDARRRAATGRRAARLTAALYARPAG